MNLKQLEEKGGLVSGEPVPKKVKWVRSDGEIVEFDILVKPLSYGRLERIIRDLKSDEDDDDRSYNALVISECVVLDEGERISYEDAYRMRPGLATAISNVVREVNGHEGK